MRIAAYLGTQNTNSLKNIHYRNIYISVFPATQCNGARMDFLVWHFHWHSKLCSLSLFLGISMNTSHFPVLPVIHYFHTLLNIGYYTFVWDGIGSRAVNIFRTCTLESDAKFCLHRRLPPPYLALIMPPCWHWQQYNMYVLQVEIESLLWSLHSRFTKNVPNIQLRVNFNLKYN